MDPKKITSLTCPVCGIIIPRWTREGRKTFTPSFVILHRHMVTDHAEDTGVTRGQFDAEIARAEGILNPAATLDAEHRDEQQRMAEHIDEDRAIDAELRQRGIA